MSTSLLYHAFGIIGYFYQSTSYIAGAVIVAIRDDYWRLRCTSLSKTQSAQSRAAGTALANGTDRPESGLY